MKKRIITTLVALMAVALCIAWTTESGNTLFTGMVDVQGPFYLESTEVTATATELNKMDGTTATTSELNNAADVSARVQELTATGDVTAGVQSLELNHDSSAIAATIADAGNHQGLFVVKDTSASGTESHTLTLTSGTFNGSNDVATLNAPNECLVVYFDSAGNGTIVENVDSVSLSSS